MDFDRTKDSDANSDDDNEIQDEVTDTVQVQLSLFASNDQCNRLQNHM